VRNDHLHHQQDSNSSQHIHTARHFFTNPTHLVHASLKSLTLTNPSLSLDETHKIVYRTPDAKHDAQVSLISGGGSGHEPSFAGFVGDGLLAASVAGTIFASPGAEQVRRAILARVGRGKGVCVVVMNYTVCIDYFCEERRGKRRANRAVGRCA
jgi:triose/dihydroxyacetone kinase / FAD-AMP lyase (cyclizing)